MPIQSLPPDILDRILYFAHIQAAEPPRNDIRAYLRVNKAFYLSGISSLYRHVKVKRFDLFFLASSSFPSDVGSLDPAELVQAGQFKLAALRYVRHIFIDMAFATGSDEEEDLQISEELKGRIVTEHRKQEVDRIERATSALQALPPKALTRVASIQVGEVEYHRAPFSSVTAWSNPRLTHFAPLLVKLASPKFYCQYPRQARYHDLGLSVLEDGASLHMFISHVHLLDDFYLSPGRVNYIYVHEDARQVFEKGIQSRRNHWRPVGVSDIKDWLQGVLSRILPRLGGELEKQGVGEQDGQDESGSNGVQTSNRADIDMSNGRCNSSPIGRREESKHTKIVIGGVARSGKKGALEAGSEMIDADGVEDRTIAEIQTFLREGLGRGLASGIKDDLIATTHIEVKRARDMPPCSSCGMHL